MPRSDIMNEFPKLTAGDTVSLADRPGKWIVRTIVKGSKADLQSAGDFGSIIRNRGPDRHREIWQPELFLLVG